MPKYWGKQNFSSVHDIEIDKERKKKVSENNGQICFRPPQDDMIKISKGSGQSYLKISVLFTLGENEGN